jgi:hypothetical protein
MLAAEGYCASAPQWAILAPMTFPVKTIRTIFFILPTVFIVPAFAGMAAGDEDSNGNVTQLEMEPARDELERWVPALSVSLGMLLQRGSADTSTNDVNVIDAPPSTDPFFFLATEVRPPSDGQDLMFTPSAAIALELMTPGVTVLPGRPRLFLHGDLDVNFSQTYDLAKDGNPGDFVIDVPDPGERVVLGQGTVLQAHVADLALSAGLGVALTLDIFERRVRIKPSFEWLREKVILVGELRRLIKNPIGPLPLELTDFRQILLNAKKTKVFNGIGGGLEIEVDSKRAGPIVVSTFMGARVHRILGELKVVQVVSNEFNETVFFRYKNRRWDYQAFMGIRIRLVPE